MSFLSENAKEPVYTEQQLKDTYIPVQNRKPKYTNANSSTGLPNYGMSPWNIVESVLAALNIAHVTYQNGLIESPPFTVEWGGNLIRNTTINGQSLYSVTFNNVNDFNVVSADDIVLRAIQPTGLLIVDGTSLDLRGRSFLYLKTPNYDTSQNGAILQLKDLGTGQVEYTPYALPLTDGTPNQYLATNGSGTVGWVTLPSASNKCEVLYFTDNPLNVTWPDVVASGSMASYTLPGGTFITDGDYLEYEASAIVTGSSGDIPEFHVRIGAVTLANTAHTTDHAFTIVTKGKIIRVSATAYFARIESSVYSPTGTLLQSYGFLQSGAITWSNPNDIIYHVEVGVGDHVSELQHFVLTKYLK